MTADEGSRVTIKYICKLEDGTVLDMADRDTLEFVIGEGNTLPSLETGVIGMKPGEQRTIRVSAAEADDFPFTEEDAPGKGFSAGTGKIDIGYDFAPDEGAEVVLAPATRPMKSTRKYAADFIFQVEMLAVTDAELDLAE